MSDEQPKKRVVTWEKTDKHGHETAFALIDLQPEPPKQVDAPTKGSR